MNIDQNCYITLTQQESEDLVSVLEDFFAYMKQLRLGEESRRAELAQGLINELTHKSTQKGIRACFCKDCCPEGTKIPGLYSKGTPQ